MNKFLPIQLATCPPLGLCLPAEFMRARDPDTIEWRVPGSAFVWASRLIDVWAPESNRGTAEMRELSALGKAFVTAECTKASPLRVYIPLPKGPQPLRALTFDRIPSYVYLSDTQTLNQLVVAMGFASSKKNGPLGQ